MYSAKAERYRINEAPLVQHFFSLFLFFSFQPPSARLYADRTIHAALLPSSVVVYACVPTLEKEFVSEADVSTRELIRWPVR